MASLKKWFLGELVEHPLEEQAAELSAWFQSPCGQLLLESEQAMVQKILPSLFGYHVVQMSIHEQADLMESSPIHHQVKLMHAGEIRDANNKGVLTSEFSRLPFDTDSVDVIILHHVLEFSLNPHDVLKEVNRVLMPRGQVIIVGFNPLSLWGLWKGAASLFSKKAQWHYDGISRKRLLDWFKLIDLSKVSVDDTFYRVPVKNLSLLNRFLFLEKIGQKLSLRSGGAYLVSARKDINAVIPTQPSFGRLEKTVSDGLRGMATQTSAKKTKQVLH